MDTTHLVQYQKSIYVCMHDDDVLSNQEVRRYETSDLWSGERVYIPQIDDD